MYTMLSDSWSDKEAQILTAQLSTLFPPADM